MARLGAFDVVTVPTAWAAREATANGWFCDEAIEEATAPPSTPPGLPAYRVGRGRLFGFRRWIGRRLLAAAKEV